MQIYAKPVCVDFIMSLDGSCKIASSSSSNHSSAWIINLGLWLRDLTLCFFKDVNTLELRLASFSSNIFMLKLRVCLTLQRTKAPALVPEEADPIWSVGARSILSKGTGMKQRIGGIVKVIHSRLGDPRIGPVLLLGALMSFGNIWLRRSQSTPPIQSNQEAQPSRTVSMMHITFFISGIQISFSSCYSHK